MADVFKTIFEMDGQGSTVLSELDAIKAKYTGINTSMRSQEEELKRLVIVNNRLKDAATNAHNPTKVVFYRNEIAKNEARIKALNNELKAVETNEKKVAAGAMDMSTKLNKAFTTTSVNALNTSLEQVEKELKDTETQATKTGDDLEDTFEKPEEKVLSLRSQLKILKADLANATDPEEITRLATEAGKLQDKIEDASDAARIFASDSPFEQVGNGIGSVAQKLANLDFAGAAAQSRLLLAASKQITFKETIAGIKDLGTTLLNTGRALLTNPIFLIGASIALIVTNFDKLKASGGVIGKIFRGISDAGEGLKLMFFELTDAIGLTTHALDELDQKNIDRLTANLKRNVQLIDGYIKITQAAGKETEKAELLKQKAIIRTAQQEAAIIDAKSKRDNFQSEEQKKRLQELVETVTDANIEILTIEAKANKERKDKAKKNADDALKIFEDLNKRIKALRTQNDEFSIAFKVENNSEDQLKQTFDLRKKLEEEELAELRKKTLAELKTESDKNKALDKLDIIDKQTRKNREQEFEKQKLDLRLENAQKALDLQKQNADKAQDKFQDDQNVNEFIIANNKLDIQKKYYADSIALLEKDIAARKALGLNTVEQEKALFQFRLDAAVDISEKQDAVNKAELADRIKSIDAYEAHVQSSNQRLNKLGSTRIKTELEAERSRLAAMIASGEAEEEAIRAKNDRILQLEKDLKRARINEVLDFTKTFVDATLSAVNQVLAAKQKEVEGQIELQQKRVDEVKNIAQDGNAEMLEEEKKRLDNLTKEREKFVRQQQALAVVELIANTAITVSKAAAEGGVAAGVTIAAALIALVGGLVAARNIASQAAFYDGGYTGDGNPRDESNAIGKKPYTYHKGEFVFDHIKTRENRSIFEDIHKGKINLKELKEKSEMFDAMKMLEFNKKADVFFKTAPNNSGDISRLESKFDSLINAVESQERALVQLDEDGLRLRLSRIEARKSLIQDLAK